MLLVDGAGDEHLVGDLVDELAAAGAHHVPRPGRSVRVRWVALLELVGEPDLRRVDVLDGEAVARAVLDQVDRAPVRNARHRHVGDAAQPFVAFERAGEHLADPREKGGPLFGRALRLVELRRGERGRRQVAERPRGLDLYRGELVRVAVVERERRGRQPTHGQRYGEQRTNSLLLVGRPPVGKRSDATHVGRDDGLGERRWCGAVGQRTRDAERRESIGDTGVRHDPPAARFGLALPDRIAVGGDQLSRELEHCRAHRSLAR